MQNTPMQITPEVIWGWIAAILAAIVLISNAAEKIVHAWKAAKAPNDKQNEQIADLERRMKAAESKLSLDHARFEAINESNRITQQALLALLDHGIDGNNIAQMQSAKDRLQEHLINR